MNLNDISYNAAFLAGLLSFLSPCILPLIPAYFTFITGFSLDELTGDGSGTVSGRIRWKVVLSTLFFVCGFSSVFILWGASASLLGGVFHQFGSYIRIGGGVVVIVLGIHLTGLVRIGFLEMEKRIQMNRPLHMLGTFFIGMAFGAGWSPCVGPLLGTILVFAANQETLKDAIILLSLYAFGLALPFMALSFFVNYLIAFIQRAVKFTKYINYAAGIMLIVLGLFLITNKLMWITI